MSQKENINPSQDDNTNQSEKENIDSSQPEDTDQSEKKNMGSSEHDVFPFNYDVMVCTETSFDACMLPHEYIAQAPASLLIGDAKAFAMTLKELYSDQILSSRSWKCATCSEPAGDLYHEAIPFLAWKRGTSILDFKPQVLDIMVPICVTGGACELNAEKFMKQKMLMGDGKDIDKRICNNCGEKAGAQICGGCKMISYCSKECQIKSWPSHKTECKQSQKEGKYWWSKWWCRQSPTSLWERQFTTTCNTTCQCGDCRS